MLPLGIRSAAAASAACSMCLNSSVHQPEPKHGIPMSLFSLSRIQLGTLVGFAGFGGLAGGCACYFLLTQNQNRLREQPYFRKSLLIFNNNRRAVELVGKPIKIELVDMWREGTVFEQNKIDLKIPLKGKKRKVDLRVKAHRSKQTQKWLLDWVELTSDDDELKDKKFILHKGEVELVKDPII